MVLHINLRDKAPPFKGGDPVFESRVSFIYAGVLELEDKSNLKFDGKYQVPYGFKSRSRHQSESSKINRCHEASNRKNLD